MTTDNAQIMSYFSSNLERLKNAKDQLTRAALNYCGPQVEANMRLTCNETKLAAIEAKLKELATEFEEQKRLEMALTSKHDGYLAVLNEIGRNTEKTTSSSGDRDGKPSSEIDDGNQLDEEVLVLATKGPIVASAATAIQPTIAEENEQDCDDPDDVQLLTDDEFAEVPKYLKSHTVTVAQINVIVTKLNNILEKKYRLLSMGMKGAGSREAKDDYLKYKEQEVKELKGRRACTESDLRESLSPRDINSLKFAIPILRHCRRIKDVRVGKVTYLAVL